MCAPYRAPNHALDAALALAALKAPFRAPLETTSPAPAAASIAIADKIIYKILLINQTNLPIFQKCKKSLHTPQIRCAPDVLAMHLRCTRDAPELHPRCARDALASACRCPRALSAIHQKNECAVAATSTRVPSVAAAPVASSMPHPKPNRGPTRAGPNSLKSAHGSRVRGAQHAHGKRAD